MRAQFERIICCFFHYHNSPIFLCTSNPVSTTACHGFSWYIRYKTFLCKWKEGHSTACTSCLSWLPMDKNCKLCEQIKVLYEQTGKIRRMNFFDRTVFTVFINVARGSTTHTERTACLLGTRGTKSWSMTRTLAIKHFRFASLSKRGLLLDNHSYENEFNLYVNKISFSYEWMGTKTRLGKRLKVIRKWPIGIEFTAHGARACVLGMHPSSYCIHARVVHLIPKLVAEVFLCVLAN